MMIANPLPSSGACCADAIRGREPRRVGDEHRGQRTGQSVGIECIAGAQPSIASDGGAWAEGVGGSLTWEKGTEDAEGGVTPRSVDSYIDWSERISWGSHARMGSWVLGWAAGGGPVSQLQVLYRPESSGCCDRMVRVGLPRRDMASAPFARAHWGPSKYQLRPACRVSLH